MLNLSKFVSFVLVVFGLCSIELSAERGMVTLYRQSEGDTLLVSLIHLQDNLGTELPVEIWVDQEEMTADHLKNFSKLNNVSVRKVVGKNKQNSFTILEKTRFSEVVWFDPSSVFVTLPEKIFEDINYQETGAFFFKRYQFLLKNDRKNAMKVNKEILSEITKLLDPVMDKLPFYFKSKIYQKPTRFLSKFELVFTDPDFFYINLQKHQRGLKKAIQISEQEAFSSLNASDCLWLGMFTSEENFSMNFVKRVELEGSVNSEARVAGFVHLYRGKALLLESFDPRMGEVYSLVEPLSRASRPLIDYEVKAIPEFVDAYLFIEN